MQRPSSSKNAKGKDIGSPLSVANWALILPNLTFCLGFGQNCGSHSAMDWVMTPPRLLLMRRIGPKSTRALGSGLMAGLFLLSNPAQAHETGSTMTTSFNLSGVQLISNGPFKPGDLLTFELVTDLPKSEFHFIQVTGDCLAYPAEWHEGAEDAYLNNSKTKQGQAVAVVSSGCVDGEHAIQEVMLVAKDNTFARLTSESAILPSYQISKGHFVATPPPSKLSDSINLISLQRSQKLAKNGRVIVATLPRLSANGQTLSWTALGSCKLKREFGLSDLGGQVIAAKAGKCSISANTPWGSHLYSPVNNAIEITIYSKNAIRCVNTRTKVIAYTESPKCPNGYVKK